MSITARQRNQNVTPIIKVRASFEGREAIYIVDRMEQIWAKAAIRPAEIPVPENRRRLLKQHTHATKTAAAVNA